jgi:zinc D-Ala-D-Ala carboxypeptidase
MSHDRRQDFMGGAVALFGMAMTVLLYMRGDMTTSRLIACLGVVAFGAYLVAPKVTRSALTDGAALAERMSPFFPRAGRRDTDPLAVPLKPIEIPDPVAMVADDDVTAEHPMPGLVPNGAAKETRPPPAKRKRAAAKRAPSTHTAPEPADVPEGEEFGAEQVDSADLPAKHEHADYRPLGLLAIPDPGKGDERVGTYFVVGEFAVSGSHPELVEAVPPALVPQVRKLASTILDVIRKFVGKPVTVLSGYRPPRLNAAVGGSPTSQHLHAAAADITCEQVRLVFEAMVGGSVSVPCGQVIFYPSKRFIHVATPGWRYRAPTFQVHEPSLGLRYRTVTTVKDLRELIGA